MLNKEPLSYFYHGKAAPTQLIRFAMALMGTVLVSYTLEIYPSDVRRLGFSVCLGVSSVGSILLPWLNKTFIIFDLSGFISFVVASGVVIYFLYKLEETNGQMKAETIDQMENSNEISLKNWASLNFN